MITIKKGDSLKNIQEKFTKDCQNQRSPKGINMGLFFNKLKLKQNPLVIQKKLRNEW